ncbi:PTS sugar transporter subunit IIA [Lactobacillus sp. ESL0228]|uniref:PTS sugar transporter subunit IIA n=1 Tax=Lactobacillus sp. ESL0228 TaxID=2069352 RepID=UPI000EFC5435|nr:PTS sugar transporter subunit IIA [Lactobacillus sp. ESL0228]RMC51583.1 PTS sugar transporter subunit IIA [Lactobacillus sp. ESL0228]
MFFDQKIINLGLDAETNIGVITRLAEALKQEDVVKDSYLAHVLSREKSFPTGLQLEGGIGIAIPHTDSDYVNKSQIALATLQKPVSFKSMVDKEVDVKVNLVFMIAMSQPHEQAQLLSNLMTFCQNESGIKALLTTTKVSEAYEILTKYNLN